MLKRCRRSEETWEDERTGRKEKRKTEGERRWKLGYARLDLLMEEGKEGGKCEGEADPTFKYPSSRFLFVSLSICVAGGAIFPL